MSTEKFLYHTTRTRTLIITAVSMVLIGAIVAIYSFSKNNNPKVIAPAPKLPSNIIITPGAKSSDKYVELQENENLLGTKKAEEQGKTFIPTIINQEDKNSINNANFKKELTNILKEKQVNNNDYERLSKQLAMLLAELNKQQNSVESLLKLLRELQNQGYNIEDLEKLLKKLLADGYKTEELSRLLEKLKQQGYAINDVENLLKKFLTEGYNPDLINKILDQLLQDRLKRLEDLLKKLQEDGLNTKNLNSFNKQINIPELANLFEELGKQRYNIDSLDNLLKQLMDKGYNIFDINILFRELKQDGYNVDKLQYLLNQLKANGKEITDLKSLIDALNAKLTKNTKNNELQNKLSKVLNNSTNIEPVNTNYAYPNDPNNKVSNVDPAFLTLEKKYQDLLKKQEEKLKEAENARKIKENTMITQEMKTKDIDSMLVAMNAQVDNISKNLTKIPTQTFIKGEEQPNVGAGSISQSQSFSKTPKYNKDDMIIKAGTILFGVIDTNINSDQPGPILAKIVHGQLKGTLLIGSIQTNSNKFAEGLIISFQTANIPNKIRSYSIAAIAIDPDTARTAIATDVDHHYLLRWGAIFASTFLQGYSKSIAESGNTTTQTINPLTGATSVLTTPNPSNSSKKKIGVYQGLSDVAGAWSSNIGDLASRPTTIKIDAGTSIGIMLTADFIVSTNEDVPENKEQLNYEKVNTTSTMKDQNTTNIKNDIQQGQTVQTGFNNKIDNKEQIKDKSKNINSINNIIAKHVDNNQNINKNDSNVRR